MHFSHFLTFFVLLAFTPIQSLFAQSIGEINTSFINSRFSNAATLKKESAFVQWFDTLPDNEKAFVALLADAKARLTIHKVELIALGWHHVADGKKTLIKPYLQQLKNLLIEKAAALYPDKRLTQLQDCPAWQEMTKDIKALSQGLTNSADIQLNAYKLYDYSRSTQIYLAPYLPLEWQAPEKPQGWSPEGFWRQHQPSVQAWFDALSESQKKLVAPHIDIYLQANQARLTLARSVVAQQSLNYSSLMKKLNQQAPIIDEGLANEINARLIIDSHAKQDLPSIQPERHNQLVASITELADHIKPYLPAAWNNESWHEAVEDAAKAAETAQQKEPEEVKTQQSKPSEEFMQWFSILPDEFKPKAAMAIFCGLFPTFLVKDYDLMGWEEIQHKDGTSMLDAYTSASYRVCFDYSRKKHGLAEEDVLRFQGPYHAEYQINKDCHMCIDPQTAIARIFRYITPYLPDTFEADNLMASISPKKFWQENQLSFYEWMQRLPSLEEKQQAAMAWDLTFQKKVISFDITENDLARTSQFINFYATFLNHKLKTYIKYLRNHQKIAINWNFFHAAEQRADLEILPMNMKPDELSQWEQQQKSLIKPYLPSDWDPPHIPSPDELFALMEANDVEALAKLGIHFGSPDDQTN